MLTNLNADAHIGQSPRDSILLHKNKGGHFKVTQALRYKERHWAMDLKNPQNGNFATLEVDTIIILDGEDLRFAHGEGDKKFYHKAPFIGAKFRDGNGDIKEIYILDKTFDDIHTSLNILEYYGMGDWKLIGVQKGWMNSTREKLEGLGI